MGDAGTHSTVGKIQLYTNHSCPWAHRTHIVLRELGLPYEETLIDLEVPRPDWYLKINPRGLVPAVIYEHPSLPEPITVLESGLSVQFFIDLVSDDARSQKLWPSPNKSSLSLSSSTLSSSLAPLDATIHRYRINFFVDTFFSKVQPKWFPIMFASETPEHETRADEYVQAVEEHIEPLLRDAGPFFGGSDSYTLAEVLTASFILRLYDFADGVIEPKSLTTKLNALPNFSKWAKAVLAEDSLTYIWKKDFEVERAQKRIPVYREKYGKK